MAKADPDCRDCHGRGEVLEMTDPHGYTADWFPCKRCRGTGTDPQLDLREAALAGRL